MWYIYPKVIALIVLFTKLNFNIKVRTRISIIFSLISKSKPVNETSYTETCHWSNPNVLWDKEI